MNTNILLQSYLESSSMFQLKTFLEQKNSHLQLKNLKGSASSFLISAVDVVREEHQVCIVNGREEALRLQNDLENIIDKDILLFPTSYKRLYQYEKIDNANILLRTEVLNTLNNKGISCIIITYPEALFEKVVNQQSLIENTFGLRVGEEVEISFVNEMLLEYGFEKTDFVYEAGQFSIRGGIVDVFSFAHDFPFRVEFFGDEVESIRTFNPETQLSLEEKKYFAVLPDVQTRLVQSSRVSLWDYLPGNTIVWTSDLNQCKTAIQACYDKAVEQFDVICEQTGNNPIVTKPSLLFDDKKEFEKGLAKHILIEFGRLSRKQVPEIVFEQTSQPPFGKKFEVVGEELITYKEKGYAVYILSETPKHVQQLQEILNTHNNSIEFTPIPFAVHQGFIDHTNKLLVFTDHEIFERYHKPKNKKRFSKSKAITLKELNNLTIGDYVTHIDYGIGRFTGMSFQTLPNGKKQECVRLIYRDDDVVFLSIHSLHKISKYSGKEAVAPKMSKLGSPEWEKKKSKVKKRIKEIAIDLIQLYAKRKSVKGFSFSQDTYLQTELETSFLYEDTPDQARATEDVKEDMEKITPMDRLICGDVGFGKTEVAIRAAFKAVADNKQVAILVPTTVLAMQHYKTFEKRLAELPCRVDYINRFRTTKETKEILEKTKNGEIDILIGTHKIAGKNVKFKDLGLLIIDEEQKFGVAVKEKLKDLKANIDVLTLTATPIPRTLQFSLIGARDFSVINTPPPNRQAVTTEVHNFDEEIIRDAVSFELQRDGQVFFIHNRVASLDSLGNMIQKLVPEARIGIAHGQMEGKQLEKTMLNFIEHKYDVLLATNIIESGIDIPNANTIIINEAQMYGLSDLHQMRGRVGRSNTKAFCFLLTKHLHHLSSDARKRLATLEEFSDLGDGFKVSMKDLEIRGAGDILGGEQSGFINDIGFDAYQKILDDTIQELKETEFKSLFEKEIDTSVFISKVECTIETDFDILIPEDYVNNISERLRLYNELDNTKDKDSLQRFETSIEDRFGKIPPEVIQLMETVRLRWEAERLGFSRLKLKEGVMKGYVAIEGNDAYFQSETFGKILAFIQTNSNRSKFREYKGQMIITIKNVGTIEDGFNVLQNIL
ncbi:MAG: transcription-repair coupling factor [Cytophagales bacterium]|nr:transcription-repair coupling factor [Cytophagales bacterium]